MIRSQYAILAEYVREGTFGKVDILGAFDRIFARGVPAQHRHAVLVFMLVVDGEDDLGAKKAMRLTLTDPTGDLMFEQRGVVQLKPAAGTWLASARLIFEMANLPIPKFGKYLFQLEIDGDVLASHPFSVVQSPPPPQPA